MQLKLMVLGAVSCMGKLGSNVFHPDYTTGISNSKCSFQNSFYGTFTKDVVLYFHIDFVFVFSSYLLCKYNVPSDTF
jgi:hypothetical protein